jgi:hypothetical protein
MEVLVNGMQLKRLGSALLAAGLLAGAVASSATADSSTRIVSIGSSVDCAAALLSNGAPGTLTPSQTVTVGGLIRVDVSVENCGGQNLSNAQVTVGGPQAGAAQPASAFTDGSLFDSVTGSCNGAPGTSLLTCTYKSLRPSTPVTFTAYIKAGSQTTLDITAVVLFNESTNSTGSNPQTFAADGTVTVGQTTCDDFATYLSPSKRDATLNCGLSDPANGNHQSTGVKLLSTSLTSAEVSESSTGPTCVAPSGLECFGDYSDGSVPTTAGDILEWTMTIDLSFTGNTNLNLKKLIIYHWYTGNTSSTPDLTLFNTSDYSCKTRPASTGCIVSATKSGTVLTVVFRTPANGSNKLLG